MQNYLLILLVLSSKVLANPMDLSPSADQEAIAPFEFTGPITPGGVDIQLFGTAKEVYDQILVLNPAYDVFDFPTYAAVLETEGVTKENIEHSHNVTVATKNSLERRDSFNCNIGSEVGNVNMQCVEGLIYLRRLGQAWCGAPAKKCSRVSCSNNCGMYLCSKLNKEKRVRCGSIANDIQKIYAECGFDWGNGVYSAKGRMEFPSHNTELSSPSC